VNIRTGMWTITPAAPIVNLPPTVPERRLKWTDEIRSLLKTRPVRNGQILNTFILCGRAFVRKENFALWQLLNPIQVKKKDKQWLLYQSVIDYLDDYFRTHPHLANLPMVVFGDFNPTQVLNNLLVHF
jgi:hypothetical protein